MIINNYILVVKNVISCFAKKPIYIILLLFYYKIFQILSESYIYIKSCECHNSTT
jgi:hypothetical protein